MPKMPTVWMDGQLVSASETTLSVHDRSVLYGMGVFESCALSEGAPRRWAGHWARLCGAAARVGLPIPAEAYLLSGIDALVETTRQREAKVRITLTGGIGDAGLPGRVLITLDDLPAKRAALHVVTSSHRHHSHSIVSGIKSTSYAASILALREAHSHNADEALILNEREEVCEMATGNLFCLVEETIITPPLDSGCLPGITRAAVIQLCKERALTVAEEPLTLRILAQSGGIFRTSALRGVEPVASLDKQPIPTHSLVTAIAQWERES